ncbi:M4 family metallopeptidase [Aureivirga sp. CE67]|uniref:M4 family metallopeptidase n=1 Tax=Aureivirga sp. CE67 TaxID=1788983 RepID=UPI0018CB0ADB|nr:M4 family metallopeptidase [Aureivirga sp. CE67]
MKTKILLIILCLPFISSSQTVSKFENFNIKTFNGSFNHKINKRKIPPTEFLQNINQIFHLSDDYSFQLTSEKQDKLGFIHQNYQEYFHGVKIEHGILKLHIKNGILNSINGNIYDLKEANSTMKISKNKALELAKNHLKVTSLIQEYPIETVYLRIQDRESVSYKLTHKVRIDSNKPFEMCYVYMDVNSGDLLQKQSLYYNEDIEGTTYTTYNDSQTIICDSHNGSYRLREEERNIETYDGSNGEELLLTTGLVGAEDLVNSTPNWILFGVQQTGMDVHWGAEKAFDYYLEKFNRIGFDNENGKIKQYVNPPHYQEAFGNTQLNASAYGPPYNFLFYGMGNGSSHKPLVSLDIVGHEFTHLIISSLEDEGLIYQGESGALNESFADIFGTMIEFYADGNPDWKIAEDIKTVWPGFFRSMKNPKLGQYPDTYYGENWLDPNSPFDYGGVHINSSVQNFWFYLLSEGGSGENDLNDSFTVEGIGMEDAAKIAYRNLTTYLTPNATFYDSFLGSLQAAEDLFGEDSQQYQSVYNAWFAVGIYEGMNDVCNSAGVVLTEESGTLSDGYVTYLPNTSCTWLIAPPNVNQITLNFTEFNTESGKDIVKVYDGKNALAPLLGTFSGDEIPEQLITSPGKGKMFIQFITDDTSNFSGWTASYNTGLNTEEYNFSNKITVYPNPVEDKLNIYSEINEVVTYKIIDLYGKEVISNKNLESGKNTINLDNISCGVYHILFKSKSQKFSKKILVK